MEASQIAEYIKASKDALDILKSLVGFLPKGADAETAQQRLEEADKALKATEVQLAKALGYQLCQCTFPPQIMLWKQDRQVKVCPNCGNEHDPNRRVGISAAPPGWPDSRRRR